MSLPSLSALRRARNRAWQRGDADVAEGLAIRLAARCLMEGDPPAHAKELAWLSRHRRVAGWPVVWAAAEAHGPLSKPWYEKVLFPLMGRPLNETALSQAYEDAKEPLRVMEAVLSRQSYFGGQAFSIADIALAESVHLLKWGGMDPSAYSHVAAWFEKASTRPAYVSTRFVGQST